MEGRISSFMETNFRHFNAAALMDAAREYKGFMEKGGKMFLAMAGAMSSAELGISLSKMIREDKIHAISCTGANLEEDLYNLIAHAKYKRVPHYRYLSKEDELALYQQGLNRVTDTCIPEEEAMIVLDKFMKEAWIKAEEEGKRKFPHEFLYELLLDGKLEPYYDNPPEYSWLLAAAQKKLPIFIGGWEDSTLGNSFAAFCYQGVLKNPHTVKSGIEYMINLIDWYKKTSQDYDIGFFQIGGGIAGDFPICVVPLIEKDLKEPVKKWKYFCQISESITSFGSYSGAVPNEKITWGKLDVDTPSFIIESDATIVAPLIFAYVLGE